MIKLCSKSVVKPVSIIFKNCIDTGTFPDIWKRSNIIPVHKKGDKQIVDNYRTVSLLPIFGKILEKLLFNSIMDFLEENNLLNSNQSGFRSNDSCESQLLSIVHDIYSSFDCYPSLEVRGIFLDISKAFDRVWHEGLIYKIQSTEISGTALKLIKSFLSGRFQRVLLNSQTTSWSPILASVPQGSILGPLFFLIYINDLGNNLSSTVKLFADDTSIFSIVHDIDLSSKQLNDDLKKISDLVYQWKIYFNPDFPNYFLGKLLGLAVTVVTFNNFPVAGTLCQKHLGLYLDKKLSFRHRIKEKISKACKGIVVIIKLYYVIPRHSLLTIYESFICPHLDYGNINYDLPNNQALRNRLETVRYNVR